MAYYRQLVAHNPETNFKIRLFGKLKKLKHSSIYYKKLVAGSVSGIPDVLLIVDGTIIMPELKVGDNYPTPIQWRNIDLINNAGGFAFPLYPEEEDSFIEWIKSLVTDFSDSDD